MLRHLDNGFNTLIEYCHFIWNRILTSPSDLAKLMENVSKITPWNSLSYSSEDILDLSFLDLSLHSSVTNNPCTKVRDILMSGCDNAVLYNNLISISFLYKRNSYRICITASTSNVTHKYILLRIICIIRVSLFCCFCGRCFNAQGTTSKAIWAARKPSNVAL